MPETYPVPTNDPFGNIDPYIPYLLTAIDAALDRGDVWEDTDEVVALGWMEELKAWCMLELPPVTIPMGSQLLVQVLPSGAMFALFAGS